MEEASQVRRAAREAVRDVGPERFGDAVGTVLDDGSMTPGVLAVACARAIDESVAFDTVAERAAGTQLIYEGLRLTRELATDPPWEGAVGGGADTTFDPDIETGANVDVLVADVLVARGFHLLARTEAAGTAVETVRSFGRDQTRRRSTAETALDTSLEADVFELAAVAGTTAVGAPPSTECREFVAALARTDDGLPTPETVFGPSVRESLRTFSAAPAVSGEGVRPSAPDS
ncbi:DUF7114 family protein [Halococcus salifodinae]|uniref:Uncharacterized protein n=1 Tax=Halococcus salifodinae DSM 8989 TaxID=1227456 RepID=M0NDD8_9EURY|nr:hypothetical protein [Halococcus salifodinae]EMA55558.1 hypothetical protein C450_02289 [Halococcus salifodinae DSM 8989]